MESFVHLSYKILNAHNCLLYEHSALLLHPVMKHMIDYLIEIFHGCIFEVAFFVSTGYGTVKNALRFVVLDDAFRSLFVSLEIGNLSIETDSQKPDR